jgi:hypothetical protein
VLAVVAAHQARAADELEAIKVLAQVRAKPYYVGQAVELRIAAEGGSERPEVIPPTIRDADVALIDTLLIPVDASAIGETASERNLFVTRYRIVPHHAGSLRIPPVRVRLGTRTGVSSPLSIVVRSLPALNRPAEFLGGVGAFAVKAEASPRNIRVGQDLLYTIEVSGPAARGTAGTPDLGRLRHLPLGLEVNPLPVEARDQPPSRQFRFRIRATLPGEASLPPVAIAGFDPESAQYVTRVTTGIPIRVVEQPPFDPATVKYSTPTPVPRRTVRPDVGFGRAVTVLVGFLGVAVVVSILTAVRTLWRSDPRGQLLRRARRLDPRWDAADAARVITQGLAQFLERTSGRALGALTPFEARRAVEVATHDSRLADRAAQLVSVCDRARYSALAADTATLVAEARTVFKDIAGQPRQR